MTKIFGIPVGGLTAVLVILLAVALAVVAALAVRNRVFFRLGVRNIKRRRGRTVLIVTGLMLGTAIISAALATGDTMSHTIRAGAATALGQTDEVIAPKGIEAALASESGGTGGLYFPEGYANLIARSMAGKGLVDGVAPVIVEPIAVQDATSRQTEPRVTLFATDAKYMRGFGQIHADGKAVSLADLRPGEIYVNAEGADKLNAQAGDTVQLLSGNTASAMRIKSIVTYEGGATDGAGVLMPLDTAQQFLGKTGLVRAIFVSNTGGVGATDEVMRELQPAVRGLGLEADNTKQDALDLANSAGAAFMSFFTTFGSFSIAAGILLIFLIFVMLAAERRGELGIARAVGTRRNHLVQLFLFEGLAYDLLAAAVGVLLGVAVAYGMVLAMAAAFSSAEDFTITYSVKPTTFLLGYSIGVLLTLLVVVVSARRVSRMNIVTAIRDLPEPPREKGRRRRLVWAALGLVAGALLVVSGVSSKEAVVLGLGVSLVILSLVPILHQLGLRDRTVHTAAGLALVLWFVLPITNWLFGTMKVNFSIFILAGLMIVIGASWTIMYNADVLLGGVAAVGGRIRALAPVLRMSIAYPLRSLFRTGVTLAMFTLVVFTLVVGATTSGAFTNAFNDLNVFGGGFDIRATSSPAQPIVNMPAAVARTPGLDRRDFSAIASVSQLPVKARQLGVGAGDESYVVNGADASFLTHTTYGLAARARGYGSNAAVWRAIRDHKNLAVVDQYVVPRKENWNFAVAQTKFALHGFYLEDEVFDPVPVTIRDQQTGKHMKLTVIGVLSDSAPEFMYGLWTSQRSLAPVFGTRVLPTVHFFALQPGVDPKATAHRLEAAFLPNGMQADSLKEVLHDLVAANVTMNRLVMGFMGLGLIVGVAALGVITARAVVERRQQIGVLRAIGFRKGMVQLAFLLESSFVALTSIVVGTFLGLVVAYNVISDSQSTPSWENLSFDVPWANLGIIFLVVYLVALGTTWLPALRASRIYPAEALRYQ
ncbi:MAG TPA: FtsX-like permease family protein [Gaiellaceae bacterium]|nr:FtsX-like permease family protein [Gaiellaceae bacterium]